MRVLHGRGLFWTACLLLLTGKAAAQTYPNQHIPANYGHTPVAQVQYDDVAPPQPVEPVYVNAYGGPAQSPVQANDDGYKAAMSGGWNEYSPPVWFGSAGAVFFKRQESDRRMNCYSGDAGVPTIQYRDAGIPTTIGPNITLGRYLGCGDFGVQFVYWGLYPSLQETNTYSDANLGFLCSTLDWEGVDYYDENNALAEVEDVFDRAERHRLQRNQTVHNFEVNFLMFSSAYGNGCGSACATGFGNSCGNNFRYSFLAGFRYMHFGENLLFSADADDTVFGTTNNELHYFAEVKNRLAGFQIGGRGDYFFTQNVSVFGTAKAGVYGNNMSMAQSLYGPGGFAVVSNPVSSNFGRPYNITGSKTDVAFISDFSVGLSWNITKCWSVNAGYQVIAATGIAEVNDQIPLYFYQLQENSHIRSDGTLILHGAFAGVNYNF